MARSHVVNAARCAALIALALAQTALAQTPTQMEYERQQREYWRQQEQQRQEQQRQQQLMQDNARRQQEESRRAMSPAPGLPSTGGSYGATPMGPGGGAGAQLEQARQTWLKRPPLPPDRNPLLGTWSRPTSGTSRSSDPFAQLGAMMKGGLCEVLFSSDGLFEFRPTSLVGIDKRTRRADPLDQVEYRGGDARRVVVIPKASLKLMMFDFEGPNRIHWVGQNCTLTRVGGQGTAAAP